MEEEADCFYPLVEMGILKLKYYFLRWYTWLKYIYSKNWTQYIIYHQLNHIIVIPAFY